MKNGNNLSFALVLLHPVLLFGLLLPRFGYSQDDPLTPKDFSKTNSVTLLLVHAARGDGLHSDGVDHAYWEKDGVTAAMAAEGVPCRCLNLKGKGFSCGYLYFALAPGFKETDVANVRIDVEYFDGIEGQRGVFGLEYDASTTSGNSLNSAYTPARPSIQLRGSKQWRTATFHIRGAAFDNAQNGHSDFRLWARPPEFCVSRVTVTRDSGPQSGVAKKPLTFDATGETRLAGWISQPDLGNPSFSIQGSKPGDWLEIRAQGPLTRASWRTTVSLEEGLYQFVGKVRTEGLESGTAASGAGVTLRMSGRPPSSRIISEADDWTTLTYDFRIPAATDAELVCEFRGSKGRVLFAVDSLKLIRKSKTGGTGIPIPVTPQ